MLTFRKALLLLIVLGAGYSQSTYTILDKLRQRIRLICSPLKKGKHSNFYVGNDNQFEHEGDPQGPRIYPSFKTFCHDALTNPNNHSLFSSDNTVRGDKNEIVASNSNHVWGNYNKILPYDQHSVHPNGNNTIWGDGNTIWTAQESGGGNWLWGDRNIVGSPIDKEKKTNNCWVFGSDNCVEGSNCLILASGQSVRSDNQIRVSRSYKIAGLAAACFAAYTFTAKK